MLVRDDFSAKTMLESMLNCKKQFKWVSWKHYMKGEKKMNITELRKERQRLRISVRQLAIMMGYSYTWIYKAEEGETRISKVFIKKYEDALKNYKKLLNIS